MIPCDAVESCATQPRLAKWSYGGSAFDARTLCCIGTFVSADDLDSVHPHVSTLLLTSTSCTPHSFPRGRSLSVLSASSLQCAQTHSLHRLVMSAVTFHPSTSDGRLHQHRSAALSTKTPTTSAPASTDSASSSSIPEPTHLIPRLDDLALHHLALHLPSYPAIDALPAHYLPSLLRLMEPLPPLPLTLAATYITSPAYWQWRSEREEGAKGHDVREHGGCYRRLVCERWLSQRLEGWKAERHDKGWVEDTADTRQQYLQLLSEVRAVAPFIHTVQLNALPSHCDLSDVLSPCTRLSSLVVRFGARQLLMDHDMQFVGMQRCDALHTAKLLLACPALTKLGLSNNRMTDEHVGLLLKGLRHSVGLTSLDLSHNDISDSGAAVIASLLPLPSCLLMTVDLSDNNIGPAGAAAMASALPLLKGAGHTLALSLSLNPLTTTGALPLLAALSSPVSALTSLQLTAVGADEAACEAVVRAVRSGGVSGRLKELSVGGNTLVKPQKRGEEEKEESTDDTTAAVDGAMLGEQLLGAVRENRSLLALDLSGCGLEDVVVQQMQQLLFARIEAEKAVQRKALEARRVF